MLKNIKANQLFYVESVIPISKNAKLRHRNIVIKPLDGINVPQGPGIYFIFYKKVLIYVGIYSKKDKNINKVRWIPHLETMTMRGQKVTLSLKAQKSIKSSGYSLFQCSDQSFTKDKGRVSSTPRALFAARNWNDFKDATPDKILNHFTFALFHINKSKKELEKIEKRIIEKFPIFKMQRLVPRVPDNIL